MNEEVGYMIVDLLKRMGANDGAVSQIPYMTHETTLMDLAEAFHFTHEALGQSEERVRQLANEFFGD